MSDLLGNNPYRIYRQQQVSALSTGRLVLLALETALRACRSGQRGLLARVLEELLAGLDLGSGEVAAGFFRLYEYMLRLSREGRVEEVERMLLELKESWETAVTAEESAQARTGTGPVVAAGA